MKSHGRAMAAGLESQTMLRASPMGAILALPTSSQTTFTGSGAGKGVGRGGGRAFQVTSGEPFTVILGSFTTKVPVTELSALIMWGDRRRSNGKIVPNGAGGFSLQVSGKHTYLVPGTFGVEVQIEKAATSDDSVRMLVASIKSTVVATAPQAMPLAGTLTGPYSNLAGPAFAGSAFSFKGAGNAGIMGGVTVSGTVSFPGDGASSDAISGTFRLANSRGSVTLHVSAPFASKSILPTMFSYTVAFGTGIYSGSTGAGELAATLNSGAAGNTFTFVLS